MSQNISKPVESWELSALCLGELDSTRAEEVRHALSLSIDLQNEYNQLSETIDALRGSMNELFAIPSVNDVSVDGHPTTTDTMLAASQRDSVLAAAAKHAHQNTEHTGAESVNKVGLNHSSRSWHSAWPALAVVAASIAIVFGLSPMYLRRNQSSNPKSAIASVPTEKSSQSLQSNEVTALGEGLTDEMPKAGEIASTNPDTVNGKDSLAKQGGAKGKQNQKSLSQNQSRAENKPSSFDSLATLGNAGDAASPASLPSESSVARRGSNSIYAGLSETLQKTPPASVQDKEVGQKDQNQTAPKSEKQATDGAAVPSVELTNKPMNDESKTNEHLDLALSVQVVEARKKLGSERGAVEAQPTKLNMPTTNDRLSLLDSKAQSTAAASAPMDHFSENIELRMRSYGVNSPGNPESPYGSNEVMGTRDNGQYWNESLRRENRHGRDPIASGDRFAAFAPNPWFSPAKDPLSTVSIDVDTASYAKVRQLLNESEQLPAPGAVRIEEFVNYFDYKYATPQDDQPFSAALAVGPCPWNSENRLVRIAIQAKQVDMREREPANVVLLIDVSGSMNQPNKLPLVKRTVQTFVRQMRGNDRIAIVVYAGAAGLVLPSTSGREQSTILDAIERLSAGGSTNGGQGIQLAYTIARENFVPNGINRVVLCTDGDFNVGVTGDDALVALVKENAQSKVFLTCLGFGVGNFNDSMMEKISNEGNGVYGFVDNDREARRWMCEKLDSSLVTVAKDVKLQIEFNPATVGSYRLVGYENRILKHEDFNNDRKDAGDVNAGHRVTAFYEIVPPGRSPTVPAVDPLRYATTTEKPDSPAPERSKSADNDAQISTAQPVASDELLTLKIRFKKPEGDVSTKVEFPLKGTTDGAESGDADFEWASHVALFATMLRDPQAFTQTQWKQLVEKVDAMLAGTKDADREEFGSMVRKAYRLVDATAPRWNPQPRE